MSTFQFKQTTTSTPEQFLAGLIDFGPGRSELFGNSADDYLKAAGDPREVVSDPDARYFGGVVRERSLVPLGKARLGRIRLDDWFRRSQSPARSAAAS